MGRGRHARPWSATSPRRPRRGPPPPCSAPRTPFTQTSDFLVDPFNKPLQTTGDEANEYGYINHFTLQPGQTRSLVHFVVIGLSETANMPNTPAGTKAGTNLPVAGSQKAAVKTLAEELTATPDLSGLTTGQLCSIVELDRSVDQSVQIHLQPGRMRQAK